MAWSWPEYASTDSPIKPKEVSRYGAMLIFLFQGLSLPVEQVLSGLLRWRLHLFCQSWNFLWAPIVALLFVALCGHLLPPELRAGILYLSFLPTTISSAVILTTSAGGNITGALFNTALSNILGVVLSPMWVLLILGGQLDGEARPDGSGMFMNLATLILFPFLCGQIARPFLLPLILKIKPVFRHISNAIILFMIYSAVGESLITGAWRNAGGFATFIAVGGAIILLLTISVLVWLSSPLFLKETSDRITGFYCGSQKTLAAGIPMATAIFSSHPTLSSALGIIVLPLIIYHPTQLLLGGALVSHFQRLGKLSGDQEI